MVCNADDEYQANDHLRIRAAFENFKHQCSGQPSTEETAVIDVGGGTGRLYEDFKALYDRVIISDGAQEHMNVYKQKVEDAGDSWRCTFLEAVAFSQLFTEEFLKEHASLVKKADKLLSWVLGYLQKNEDAAAFLKKLDDFSSKGNKIFLRENLMVNRNEMRKGGKGYWLRREAEYQQLIEENLPGWTRINRDVWP